MPIKETIPTETAEELLDLKENLSPSKETQDNEVRLGNKVNMLSSEWANTYELLLGSKRVWSVVKCEAQKWWKSKAMFMSAKSSPLLFDEDENGNTFPNIQKIQQYFADRGEEEGKARKITMISTGPGFASYYNSTLAWVNYDNWEIVGNEKFLDQEITKGKGIISISWWTIKISHTQEMNQNDLDNLIAKEADIMTMSSMKRNGKINPNGSLWDHPYGHSLVQFSNGTRWEVILNNCTPAEKQKVINSLDISRAVYADADAKTNYLDGIWIQTREWLRYSHPDNGDLFMNSNSKSGKVIKDNMPGIIIHYAVQE